MSKAYKELKKTTGSIRTGIVAAIAAVVVIAATVGIYAYINRDQTLPEEHLADGVIHRLRQTGGGVRSKIHINEISAGLEQNDAEMVAEIAENADIVTDIRYDLAGAAFEGDVDLQMVGTSLLKGRFYLDDTYIMLDVPLLYDRPLYAKYTDLYARVSNPFVVGQAIELLEQNGINADYLKGEPLEEQTVDDTIKTLFSVTNLGIYNSFIKFDYNNYRTVFVDYLTRSLSSYEEVENEEAGPSYVYKMPLDHNQTMYLLGDFSTIAEEDPLVNELAKEISHRLFNRVTEDQNTYLLSIMADTYIEKWEVPKTDTFAKEVEDITAGEIEYRLANLDQTTSDVFDEIYAEVGYDPERVIEASDIDLTLTVDENDVLTDLVSDVRLDLSEAIGQDYWVDMTVTSEFTDFKDVELDGLNMDESLDFGALSLMEMAGTVTEIMDNYEKNIVGNPMLSDLFHFD